MTGRYASGTDVAPERSRAEIERTLIRYGATAFAYGWQQDRAVLSFEAHGRRIMARIDAAFDVEGRP